MAAAAMELGGALLMGGMKEPRSSAIVDLRRSLPLNVKPLRRGAAQAVLTAEPVSSVSSAPSSAGWDGMHMGGRTSYLADVKKRWRRDESEDGVTQEKLDRWLRDSISEIVRNIRKAPLLVHMFSDGEGANVSVETEAASPNIWSRITRRWNQEKRMPDGVVLVEELCRDGMENQTWGLLVQGRGTACPECYILNTCRVPSTGGFCTHFCLVIDCRMSGNISSSSRYAFIEFSDESEARAAVSLSGMPMPGCPHRTVLRMVPSKTAILPVNRDYLPKVTETELKNFFKECGEVLTLINGHAFLSGY